MEDSELTAAIETNDSSNEQRSSKYFYRQLLMASAIWALNFSAGIGLGAPTVMIPQIKKDTNFPALDDDTESWIYSIFGFAGVPWVLILPSLSLYCGRKLLYLMTCTCTLSAFIILFFSASPHQILLSEVIQGLTHASNTTIAVIIVSEYTEPKYRGIFLTTKAASFLWGVWVANAIGCFYHWRYIAVAGIVSSIYTFVGVFHPESPHWLASKGRYEQSRTAFRWLRGSSCKAESELRTIIDAHSKHSLERTECTRWQYVKESLTSRQFYLPFIITVLAVLLFNFSGKIVCSTYAIDVIQRMTDDESSAYTGMLILDGFTVFGMYVGSFISRIVKRRTLFLTSSFVGVIFLHLLALHTYLVKLSVLAESTTMSILLLIVYSISISCGPMIMSMTVIGEITPMKYQAICYTMNLTISFITFTLLLKYAPMIFSGFGMHGSFLLFGASAGVFTFALYLYLPETKDKTLLEIEANFTDKKRGRKSGQQHESVLILKEAQIIKDQSSKM